MNLFTTAAFRFLLLTLVFASFSGPATVNVFAAEAVDSAQQAVTETAETLNQRFQESRLKNRSFDQILAWVLMGFVVGALASMFTKLRGTGWGRLGRLGIGLAGALIGSMVTHIFQISFGWPPVTIYLEELIFSLVFAVILLAAIHFITKAMKTRKGEH